MTNRCLRLAQSSSLPWIWTTGQKSFYHSMAIVTVILWMAAEAAVNPSGLNSSVGTVRPKHGVIITQCHCTGYNTSVMFNWPVELWQCPWTNDHYKCVWFWSAFLALVLMDFPHCPSSQCEPIWKGNEFPNKGSRSLISVWKKSMLRMYLCQRSYTHCMVDPRWNWSAHSIQLVISNFAPLKIMI